MTGRLFTLEEANRALPLVRSITRDAVRRYAAAKREISAWEELRARAGGAPNDELARKDARIARHLEQLRRLTEELSALGCHLRDFERGVVDFPAACMAPGHFIFYCWELGDATVAHWRGEEEGIEERHLVAPGVG